MPIAADIATRLEEARTLKTITSAFSETSALKIKALKKAFEENRIYFDEIAQLYLTIQRTAAAMHYHYPTPSNRPVNNPKTIHIAITSNHRFYGALNKLTIDELFDATKSTTDEILIIGKMGIRLAGEREHTGTYDARLFKKDEPDRDEVDTLIKKTESYDRIFVYYPKFLNMFNQTVDRLDITYSSGTIAKPEYEIEYIFEPDLPKIMDFFELNVRYILFYRIILETELARTATRMITMDNAERKSDEMIHNYNRQLQIFRRAQINSELLDTFSGVSQWKKQ